MASGSKIGIVVAALCLGALLAIPAAGAFAVGIGEAQGGIVDLKAAGGNAAYGQIWAGTWLRSGWSGFDAGLANIRDSGATPIILWYYWGDSITTSCVQYGCNGMSRADWDAMSGTMATHAKSVMGNSPFLVVLEPEFNKGGIAGDPFDGYLASQSYAIKSVAPNAKTVVGFGSWGGYAGFPKAVASADYTGFQFMRASTRDSAASATGAVDSIVGTLRDIRSAFPAKPVILFDLAIGSYGGWEGVQQTALDSMKSRAGELDGAGLVGVVWRYARDNTYSSGYFGAAESTWGLKSASGVAKPGWNSLVSLARGGNVAPSIAQAASPLVAPGPSAAPLSNVFSNAHGNVWWEEVNVAGAPTSVSASINGATRALAKTSWGSWAVSANAPVGTLVTFSATFADGQTRSASYLWPAATPSGAVTSPAPTPNFSPSFTGVSGNSWWIQVDVGAAPASVSARVNGGAWIPMQHASWGSWTVSTYVPAHASVQFEATSSTGAISVSGATAWP